MFLRPHKKFKSELYSIENRSSEDQQWRKRGTCAPLQLLHTCIEDSRKHETRPGAAWVFTQRTKQQIRKSPKELLRLTFRTSRQVASSHLLLFLHLDVTLTGLHAVNK